MNISEISLELCELISNKVVSPDVDFSSAPVWLLIVKEEDVHPRLL